MGRENCLNFGKQLQRQKRVHVRTRSIRSFVQNVTVFQVTNFFLKKSVTNSTVIQYRRVFAIEVHYEFARLRETGVAFRAFMHLPNDLIMLLQAVVFKRVEGLKFRIANFTRITFFHFLEKRVEVERKQIHSDWKI